MVEREESRPVEGCLRVCFKPLLCCCPTLMTTPVTTLATALANASTVTMESAATAQILENRAIFRVAGY